MNAGKFALVIASNAGSSTLAYQDTSYRTFLKNMRAPAPPLIGVDMLAENVWQIDIDSGLHSFSRIIQNAKDWNVSIRVLFLESAPQWSELTPILNT